MKIAVCQIRSMTGSPYQQGRQHDSPKLPGENPNDYEERTWSERAHYGPDGHLYIPPTCFTKSVQEAARRMGEKIRGKGNKTWKSHFEAGILVLTPLVLPVTLDNVERVGLFVPADGTPGGGSRVKRYFPTVREWDGSVTFTMLDPEITTDIFERTVTYAGMFVGIGVFRPEKRGYNGRFSVEGITWNEQ